MRLGGHLLLVKKHMLLLWAALINFNSMFGSGRVDVVVNTSFSSGCCYWIILIEETCYGDNKCIFSLILVSSARAVLKKLWSIYFLNALLVPGAGGLSE